MKNLVYILTFFLLPIITFGQQHFCPITEFEEDFSTEICLDYKGESQFSSFKNNAEAMEVIDDLMSLAGLPMNFVVKECSGIQNAFAYSFENVRYIIYGNDFLESLNSSQNDIGSKTVLAHEIGHHLAGHTHTQYRIESEEDAIKQALRHPLFKYCNQQSEYYDETKCIRALDISRKKELEADRFAGYIMYKYGASLSDVQNAFKILLNNQDYDDEYSTHPTLSKRLAKIKEGYETAKKQEDEAYLRKTDREKGKDIDEPTQKEKIEEIKGDKIDYSLVNVDRAKLHSINVKLYKSAISKTLEDFSSNSEYGVFWGSLQEDENKSGFSDFVKSKGLEKDPTNSSYLKNESSYLYKTGQRLGFSYDERIVYGPITGFYTKDGITSIYIFDSFYKKRLVYQAFTDNIDYEKVSEIFKDIYTMSLNRKLEEYKE